MNEDIIKRINSIRQSVHETIQASKNKELRSEKTTAANPIPMKKRRFSCFEPPKKKSLPENSFLSPLKTSTPVQKSSEGVGSLKSYKEEASKMDQAIKDKYEIFFKAPESYPNYKTEWINFWNKRCLELTAAGVDPKTYDFRDDWKKVFHLRLLDLEFLEKSEMRSELFKKHMSIKPAPKQLPTPKSPVRVPEKVKEERKSPKKSRSTSWSPSPNKKPVFERLGRGVERERSKEPRSRSRSKRYDSNSPRRRSRRRRTPSPSPQRRLSVRDRLTLMSRGEYRRRQRVTGRVPYKNHRSTSPDIDFSTPTVVSVCCDFNSLEDISRLYGRQISDILITALAYEKTHDKEYCMSLEDAGIFKEIRDFIMRRLKRKRFLPQSVDAAKKLHRKIEILLSRWISCMKFKDILANRSTWQKKHIERKRKLLDEEKDSDYEYSRSRRSRDSRSRSRSRRSFKRERSRSRSPRTPETRSRREISREINRKRSEAGKAPLDHLRSSFEDGPRTPSPVKNSIEKEIKLKKAEKVPEKNNENSKTSKESFEKSTKIWKIGEKVTRPVEEFKNATEKGQNSKNSVQNSKDSVQNSKNSVQNSKNPAQNHETPGQTTKIPIGSLQKRNLNCAVPSQDLNDPPKVGNSFFDNEIYISFKKPSRKFSETLNGSIGSQKIFPDANESKMLIEPQSLIEKASETASKEKLRLFDKKNSGESSRASRAGDENTCKPYRAKTSAEFFLGESSGVKEFYSGINELINEIEDQNRVNSTVCENPSKSHVEIKETPRSVQIPGNFSSHENKNELTKEGKFNEFEKKMKKIPEIFRNERNFNIDEYVSSLLVDLKELSCKPEQVQDISQSFETKMSK